MEKIPQTIQLALDTLHEAGFEAYLVGGCVRDLLRDAKPKDWDVATNAQPEEVEKLFEHTFYENEFGTVGVVIDDEEDPTLKTIEVTTYRKEASYTDARHPDKVEFTDSVEEDLSRRDFTMNAIGLTMTEGERVVEKGTFVDPYNGRDDIEQKVIRAVGDPSERFAEDALRMMRAVRFAAELGFIVEKNTGEAIQENAETIEKIARERIRDELVRTLMSDNPREGMLLMRDLGLLQYILPELLEGEGVEQGGTHKYDVFDHILGALQATADKGWSLELRLAALFHDIGKPRTREAGKEGKKAWSFHNHEIVGATMAHDILTRLRFPNETVKDVRKLVRWHMFFSDTEQITHSAVRRMIRNVGRERIYDLMNLRIADRVGMGRPKEEPYRFRKYQAMIEEVIRDPVSVGMLALDGDDIMKLTGEKPGPRIGWILHALLEEVLEDPEKNTKKWLSEKVLELVKLPDDTLRALGKIGEEKRQQKEEEEISKIHKSFGVR